MRSFVILFTFLLLTTNIAQNTTYSDEEAMMIQYVSKGFYNSRKFNSVEQYIEIKDSCYSFFKKHPASFAKPNVFLHLLQLLEVFSKDKKEIETIADSVLYYDQLPVTKLSVAELLITNSINFEKGMQLLDEAFPKLTLENHLIRALLLKSKINIQIGRKETAKLNLDDAIKLDSTRYDVWYEYLSLLSFSENTSEYKRIQKKIKQLEKSDIKKYSEQSTTGSNIGRNLLGHTTMDINENKVSLSELKGKVTVINFFGFWCGHCINEFPVLLEFQKQNPRVNLIFMADMRYSINEIKSKYLELKEFIFLKNQNLLVSNIDKYLQIKGVPYTIVVDKDGFIRYHYAGYNSSIDKLLSKNVRQLL